MHNTDVPHLKKDSKTGAIINKNSSALLKAKKEKEKQLLIENLLERVDYLEEQLDKIRNAVKI